MPRRTDLRRILLLGSGPIVIGQACEFDYSGTQACKALRADGFEVVLVNSNPASINDRSRNGGSDLHRAADTRCGAARDRAGEARCPAAHHGRPNRFKPGGELAKDGTLERHGVELIGANLAAIEKAEDRDLFKQAMERIGVAVCPSGIATSMEEAEAVGNQIGSYPRIIRPAFTLGGSGGGIAYNPEEFRALCNSGLEASPVDQILIEKSLLGWKEFELEVMRDTADNVVIICSIENLDPMGVHTGDSITVAPAQTLTDREYQRLRDQSLAIIREIGVDTGGSNIQFAINPANGDVVVIEMNPRVSRSSALARNTGFPIAKIAARLAGLPARRNHQRHHRQNAGLLSPPSITWSPRCPALPLKVQRQLSVLTTSMKSVGEAMAIGRCFEESFQKALRSPETGYAGWGADRAEANPSEDLDAIFARQRRSKSFGSHSPAAGPKHEQVHALSAIDPWFLAKFAALLQRNKRCFRAAPQ